MPAGVVDDDRVGHAGLSQFPGRQIGALVAWAGFVDPHMDVHTGFKRLIDRGGRRAPAQAGQPAGVAMGQHIQRAAARFHRRGLLKNRKAMIADRGIDCGVFLTDDAGEIESVRRAGRFGQWAQTRVHLFQRPTQIDGCGPRRAQHPHGRLQALIARIVAHGQRHAVSGEPADQRRAANQHVADRARGVRHRLHRNPDQRMGEAGLIDNLHPPIGIEAERAQGGGVGHGGAFAFNGKKRAVLRFGQSN